MSELFGLEKSERSQISLSEVYKNPVDCQRCLQKIEVDGFALGLETELVRKNGDIFQGDVTITPITVYNQNWLLTIISDITARTRTEKILQDSQRRFIDIAKNALEWIWEVDCEGRYTFSSPVVEKILGYAPEDIIGNYFHDFFHPDDKERLLKKSLEVFSKRRSFRQFFNKNISKTGETVFLLTSGVPVISDEGRFAGYRGADLDVTQLIQQERARKQTDEHVRSLMRSAEGFVVFRMVNDSNSAYNLKFVFISPSVDEIIGIPEPMKIETWFDYIHPDDLDRIAMAEKTALHTFQCNEVFRIFNPQKGQYRWVHIIATGEEEQRQWNGYANGLLIDVTEAQIAKGDLLKSQEHLESLLQGASGFAVYRMVYDQNSPHQLKMAACSPSYQEITGIAPEKVTVSDYYDNVHPEDAKAVLDAHQKAFTTGTFDMIARVYNPVKKDYVWLHAISSAVTNEAGQITHVNGLLIDVSETQTVKEELQHSLDALNRKSKQQEELNAALNVLLHKREQDRLELEQGIVLIIKEIVAPYLQKLKNSGLAAYQKTLLALVETNLSELTSGLVVKLSAPQIGLSPAEIKVANYVKQGRSSKEIAVLCGLSPKTIKNQRISIRKKLGITNKKANLRSYLIALDQKT